MVHAVDDTGFPVSWRYRAEGPRGEVIVVTGYDTSDVLDYCRSYEPWRMWVFCGGKPTVRPMTLEEIDYWEARQKFYS